jgi:hypothetical protein
MRIPFVVLVATLALQPAFAGDPRPSEQSIQQLFQLMHTNQAMESATTQMDDTIRGSMKEATHGQPLNAEQQKIRDEAQAKMVSIIREALDWSKVEPLLVEAYRNTFTQEEVDAMLKFYTSPVGQSVGAKLPAASRQTMQLMRQRMHEIVPQIVAVQKDAAARINAAAGSSAAPEQPGAQSEAQPGARPQRSGTQELRERTRCSQAL